MGKQYSRQQGLIKKRHRDDYLKPWEPSALERELGKEGEHPLLKKKKDKDNDYDHGL